MPVTLALTLAAIAVTVILVARLCAPLGLPAPIALLLVGLVASVLPFVPDVSLDPDVVLRSDAGRGPARLTTVITGARAVAGQAVTFEASSVARSWLAHSTIQ